MSAIAGITEFAIDPRKAAAIRDARTIELAAGRARGRRAETRADLVTVKVGAERFALPLLAIAGVIAARPLGPIATRRPEIIGTLYERADLWPVCSLRALLGADGAGEPQAFLLLRHESRRVALAVDRVEGFEATAGDAFAGGGSGKSPLVAGAAPDGLMLIDPAALWRHPALSTGRQT